ncbi:aminopeptidase Y [Magnaporthiopsis poae ATCC 64411]|uniref:Peptide hydrolase n=1 Tax=Magnaporthiopsis poae (strain ATCC 64411 / 73-15) TaxID=644358 RepID=A0A0C4E117_MAGP6|nr:aminopeptidase Y [Magnaporthiopsis poae ATCC 64411]
MKASLSLYSLLALGGLVAGQAKPPMSSEALRKLLTADALMKKAQIFEDQAYSTPQRNRAVGTPGLAASLKYIKDTLSALDYYDVKTQELTILGDGKAGVTVAGSKYDSQIVIGSPKGSASGPMVSVANLGCNATDFPAAVKGAVALISRGTCSFGVKSSNAAAAGAVAAIIYNTNPAENFTTWGFGMTGSFVPTAAVTLATGKALSAKLQKSTSLKAQVNVTIPETKTYNIIAQTKGGDPNNVLQLGAHYDTDVLNPGMNDDVSGTVSILEVAIQLAKFSTKNAIRFSWWSGSENGMVGSNQYVKGLSQAERDKIRLYLNFDMVASVNWFYAIYATNGTTFAGRAPPPGVAEATKMFQDYFRGVAGLNCTSFDLRNASDHAAFVDARIPVSGLFTGGSEIKTPEQVAMFGGTAGVPSDPQNHKAGDNMTNINAEPFLQVTKAIAHAVSLYGQSFDSLPPRSSGQ